MEAIPWGPVPPTDDNGLVEPTGRAFLEEEKGARGAPTPIVAYDT